MGLSSKQVISSDGHSWNNNNNNNSISTNNNNNNNNNKSQELKCPRCDSSNTKFCYYNNYNKSQPRHFCKACKRHWTKGGTLRTVLAGGGRCKNKRLKTATTKTAASTATTTLFSDVSNFSDPFYQTLPCLSPTMPLFQPEQFDTRFEYSNLGIFESNPCSISSNHGSPNVYSFTGEAAEINASLSSGSISDHQQNWEIPMNCNSGWNYYFDEFVSGEPDLTIPWDEDYAQIKP